MSVVATVHMSAQGIHEAGPACAQMLGSLALKKISASSTLVNMMLEIVEYLDLSLGELAGYRRHRMKRKVH